MTTTSLIDSSSVILVSGGARGVTAHCVQRLAERHRCAFILLGRSPVEEQEPAWAQNATDESALNQAQVQALKAAGKPVDLAEVKKTTRAILSAREARQNLAKLRAAGSRVEYLALDVADPSLKEKLTPLVARTGGITGVIHGAGALADKYIEKKTAADFELVVAPKVDGLENLLLAVSPAQLRFCVLFSSVAALYGNAGQADYAAANEILNRSAGLLRRRFPACKTLAINWGPWEGGMVTPQLQKVFERFGVAMIPLDDGAELLIAELEGRQPEAAQVVIGHKPPRSPMKGVPPVVRPVTIRRRLSLSANPFLHDHALGGHAILPGTGALAWMASACEQLFPSYHFFGAENFKILKGITFNAGLAEEYLVELTPVNGTPPGEIAMDVRVNSKTASGRVFYHYASRIRLLAELPPPPMVALPAPGDASQQFDGAPLYQDGTLFHGPAFRGVERVLAMDEKRIVTRNRLPRLSETVMGQFPAGATNTFIYDVLVQSALIWTQKRMGAACMPARLEKLEQFRPLPFDAPILVEMIVEHATPTAIRGSLEAMDERGSLYLRMTAVEGTVSKELNRFLKAGDG